MGKKEGKIEDAICDYAKDLGFEVRKVKFIAVEGCPDRMFYGHGEIFFIEVKTPTGKLRPAQVREIYKLRKAGIKVFVVDNILDGELIIDGAIMSACKEPDSVI